jgi:hypothetical protein
MAQAGIVIPCRRTARSARVRIAKAPMSWRTKSRTSICLRGVNAQQDPRGRPKLFFYPRFDISYINPSAILKDINV